MRVAVISEGPHDQAAVKILVDAVLGFETGLVDLRRSPEGWPSVINLLPAIITDLHYRQVDVGGLVVVVDSDDTALHAGSHDTSPEESCRLCQIRLVAQREFKKLTTVQNRAPIKVAFGLAVPEIEAWYRCGLDPHVNENAWGRKIGGESVTYDRKSLKRDVYGSDRAPNFAKTSMAKQAAERLAANLGQLQLLFPNGFGSLVRDLQSW